ncbi:MAG: hypothetical protein BWK79_14020 [Beggiatoa sp. IS2]|nr:MAG: hypothetical protein BWK79_14020 [Beggiatoa sp. IS2]
MLKIIHFLLFIGYFSSRLVFAETLLELYELAEQNDPQLKIAKTERLIISEKKPQAQAQLLPQVMLGANARENLQTKNWLLGDRQENTEIGYNISLSYALYRRDRQIALDQVNGQILEVEANYENTRQTLMGRLAAAYFRVLAGNDNLKFTRAAKEAFRRQLDQSQLRYQVGLIAVTDVQEAQAGYDSAVADEIQAQNELDTAQEALREITGSYHQVLAILKEDSPLLSPDPADIDVWTQIALERNPQLVATRRAVDVARQEIERQRAAQLPTVDLVGDHRYSDTLRGEDQPSSYSTRNSVGVELNYFLYEGGAIRSRVREAKQRHLQALDQLEQQQRSVQRQVHEAYLQVLSNMSRVKALKQALVSSTTALEAVQAGFEVGTRTSVDVLNAQRDLLRAQQSYSQARYDYVLNTLKLKQAAGLIDITDFRNINEWLVLSAKE